MPCPRTVARRPRRARPLAVVLSTLVIALGVATPVIADGQAEAQMTAWINQERSSRGIAELAVSNELVEVARRHSQRMADEGRMYHNPNLGDEVSNWKRLAENVGYGSDARQVHDAFMGSSGHAANILDSEMTQVGVGVVRKDGTLWVTQVFRLPDGESAPPPPPPPEPEPEPPPPDPEPEPAPPEPEPPPAPAAPTTAETPSPRPKPKTTQKPTPAFSAAPRIAAPVPPEGVLSSAQLASERPMDPEDQLVAAVRIVAAIVEAFANPA